MELYPAIDLYDGKAVRLYKGDYAKMTVYADDPAQVARDFEAAGAKYIHLVDLEGARSGSPANLNIIKNIIRSTHLFAEAGGGIRSMETVDAYFSAGVSRVILGTAAVENLAFLEEALGKYGEKIAVGVDIKEGFVAVRGWTEKSSWTAEAFFEKMCAMGVKTVICTDISRDGCMEGTNRELYKKLSRAYDLDLIASGGVSTLEDIKALRDMGLHGAIVGKAWYTGAIDLNEALEAAK